jgi:hypothetical protein
LKQLAIILSCLGFELTWDKGRQSMASKQYGLKIVHKPSNIVEREMWFNTEAERMSAMGGSTMERDYVYVLEEKEIEMPQDAKPGEWGGPA